MYANMLLAVNHRHHYLPLLLLLQIVCSISLSSFPSSLSFPFLFFPFSPSFLSLLPFETFSGVVTRAALMGVRFALPRRIECTPTPTIWRIAAACLFCQRTLPLLMRLLVPPRRHAIMRKVYQNCTPLSAYNWADAEYAECSNFDGREY